MSQKRAEKLFNQFSGDAILITDPKNRYYYSGFTGTEATLILSKNENYIFTDSRYHIQARKQALGFTLIDTAETSPTAFLKKQNVHQVGIEENVMTVQEHQKLSQALEGVSLEGISGLIREQRKQKDPSEIANIRRAAQIADLAFSYIIDKIAVGKTERELALELEFFMRKQGAEALSFETIFASGVRSAMPHGTASEKPLEYGDFITMDYGCVYGGYCSDMTRTVVLGHASEQQKEIYHIVQKAQQAAFEVIRPGVLARDVDKAARDIIIDAGYGKHFGHSLGHSLGLDIHELPSLSPKSEERLCANMLVTDEPGIYIEAFGGVRIEDLLLITENGCESLSSSPKELLEID